MSPKQPLPHNIASIAPIGLDGAIDAIRQSLGSVTWLNPYIYGRALTDVSETGTRTPIVYSGDGEYISALPNDNLSAMSFFRTISYEKTSFDKDSRRGAPMTLERDLALIVWVNLKELNHAENGSNYIYTETLKEDIYNVLSACSQVTSIKKYDDDDIEIVYKGYDFERAIVEYSTRSYNNFGDKRTLSKDIAIKGKYIKYPFAAFRVEFGVKYYQSC